MQRNWYRLDTAALIFPAIMKRNWSNVFRLSCELDEDIDLEILQKAVDELRERFPSFYVCLRRGVFWCYLREIRGNVEVRQDFAYPSTHMNQKEVSKCCLRVLYYKKRIAVEFFHSLTDGRGGSIYLCTLTARYLELKHGIQIPSGGSVLDITAGPKPEELEDSFLKNSAIIGSPRKEPAAYRLRGTYDDSGFLTLTTGIADTERLLDVAHRYKATVTAFLSAVMAKSIIEMQSEERSRNQTKPVKITIPVDMRRLYNSCTVRNFALTLNIGVDPKLGDYSLQDLCTAITHQLAISATPQNMSGMIAANVLPQKMLLLRVCPWFLKRFVMDLVYRTSGERNGCLNISNLGRINLPDEMRAHVRRMDFIIGPQRSYPNNCSVVALGERTYINMIRNIHESELERRFFSELVALGVPIEIECNRR